ncbi:MAG: monovalent cation/H(+) antiporter subunit G [Alphaproteobacteria bacterium]|nr:monovalent cation/H(+) antiporter subunit G [Alphaproteobacteria bacterium]MBF0250837.1 monovalent cation/H(+) antiporter subunit G [Alphaproteobacteria bacterium]
MTLDLAGAILLVAGGAFLFLGGLGLYRMPDTFNRIQVGTKATTLGTVLSLAGAGCLQPEWSFKLVLIGIFLLFTNPLSSQVLARSAHRIGVAQAPETRVDHLAEDQKRGRDES